MNRLSKSISYVGIVVLALIIVERWYNIFFLGQLYAHIGMGIAFIGFAVPIVTIAGAIFAIKYVNKA